MQSQLTAASSATPPSETTRSNRRASCVAGSMSDGSDRGRAERVATGQRCLEREFRRPAVESLEHALDHPPVHSTDDGMLDRHLAEGAMVVDDPQLIVSLIGMRCEPVCRQRIGDGVERRSQRALASRQVGPGETGGHRDAILSADLFGHRPSLIRGQQLECATEQGENEIIASDRNVGERFRGRPIVLRRSACARALCSLDCHLEVPTSGQAIEVVPGNVGVEPELGRHM